MVVLDGRKIDVVDSNAIYYYHRDNLESTRTKGRPKNVPNTSTFSLCMWPTEGA